jgi:hypothetical protein
LYSVPDDSAGRGRGPARRTGVPRRTGSCARPAPPCPTSRPPSCGVCRTSPALALGIAGERARGSTRSPSPATGRPGRARSESPTAVPDPRRRCRCPLGAPHCAVVVDGDGENGLD